MAVFLYWMNFKISVEQSNTLATGNKHGYRFRSENSMWLANTTYFSITQSIVYYSLFHI